MVALTPLPPIRPRRRPRREPPSERTGRPEPGTRPGRRQAVGIVGFAFMKTPKNNQGVRRAGGVSPRRIRGSFLRGFKPLGRRLGGRGRGRVLPDQVAGPRGQHHGGDAAVVQRTQPGSRRFVRDGGRWGRRRRRLRRGRKRLDFRKLRLLCASLQACKCSANRAQPSGSGRPGTSPATASPGPPASGAIRGGSGEPARRLVIVGHVAQDGVALAGIGDVARQHLEENDAGPVLVGPGADPVDLPAACSGGMNAGVPRTVPICV